MSNQKSPTQDFDELFRTYYPVAVLFANKFVKNEFAAKDIAQQVFLKIFEKKDTIQIEVSFKAYLLRAVRNTALTYLNKEKTHIRHSEAAFAKTDQVIMDTDPVAYEQLVNTLKNLIENLPPRCQLIFKMNRLEGKKNKEIATELGLSIRTVEAQISYALKQLRSKLPKELLIIFIFFKIGYVYFN